MYLFGISNGVNQEFRNVSTSKGSKGVSTYKMIKQNLPVNVFPNCLGRELSRQWFESQPVAVNSIATLGITLVKATSYWVCRILKFELKLMDFDLTMC